MVKEFLIIIFIMKKFGGININIDEIDIKIIEMLKEDSKMPFKEIGDCIHLTGQAVGNRVNKLIDEGIIKNYTININDELLGNNIIALIKIYMQTSSHAMFKEIINRNDEIVEAHKVSADACYFIKVVTNDMKKLNIILDSISRFATYQLSLSIDRIK